MDNPSKLHVPTLWHQAATVNATSGDTLRVRTVRPVDEADAHSEPTGRWRRGRPVVSLDGSAPEDEDSFLRSL